MIANENLTKRKPRDAIGRFLVELTKEKIGKYELLRHSGGGFTIWGPGIRKRGQYVPSDKSLLKKYRPGTFWKSNPVSLSAQLYLRGVLATENNRPSLRAGREAVGIQYNNSRVSLPEIQEAIKTFWSEAEVKRFMAGEEVA